MFYLRRKFRLPLLLILIPLSLLYLLHLATYDKLAISSSPIRPAAPLPENLTGNAPDQIREKAPGQSNKTRYVLYWNEAYGSKDYNFCCGRKPYLDQKCAYDNCFATSNRQELPSVDQFDAIVFHQRSLSKSDLPRVRSPKQRYIMWMMESAQYPFSFRGSDWEGFFNWTMTYRKDSDIYNAYGEIYQRRPHPKDDPKELESFIEQFGRDNLKLAAAKQAKAAWFVSNCYSQSRREQYVKELQKHFPVDVIGRCGKDSCPRSKEAECWRNVENNYMFYLSFENSMCVDYVTEKFWHAMNRTVLPVVLGGTDYSRRAPPHSYINVEPDLKNPKDLADTLHRLAKDPAAYAAYFWWKPYYEVSYGFEERRDSGCELCRKLHTETEVQKVYNNLHNWWTVQGKCHRVM